MSTIDDESDPELIRLVGHGDRDAFKRLYLRYHRRLARFLLRLTSQRETAEEIINDAMLVVWHKNRLAYYGKHYGWPGRAWIRVCVRLRIWEERRKIARRHPHDPAARAAEREHLRAAEAELWS